MAALILVLSFVTGVLVAYAAVTPARDPQFAQRLARISQLAAPGSRTRRTMQRALVDEEELSQPFAQRVLLPIWEAVLQRAAALAPRAMRERAKLRLHQAGVTMDAVRFVGLQATCATGGALLGILLSLPGLAGGKAALGLLLTTVFAVAGARLPMVWLVMLGGRRQASLQRTLPDVLDMLSVSVEAGLGFDGAMQKVAEKFPEPTAGEFREFLREVRVGRPRAEALRRLAERSGVADLQSFAAAIIQADQLGVSIARVLRSQAAAMRQKRKQRAEERAMQLPIKLLFPLILFIFPTLFIIILGPVVMQFVSGFRF